MPFCSAPKVSIIIPVYNNYAYTRLCLWAILQHTHGVDYEVIVADDVSTDETIGIGKYIENVNISRNTTNLGFLQNCNKAARQAKGKYVLFLNNDTQVQSGWLPPLVEILENHQDVSLVGSKLVYPDNTIQEAGGIVFSDGSAWNWGRNGSISADDCNYLKEADYISGASIMLSKKLWDELGGFDERYSPAYYEDTDLAFRIRYEKGLKVVYQPLSVVVHFEGKTCGTNLNEGLKAYQRINATKFYERWQDILQKEHTAKDNIFLARDHSVNKKTLLFIDHGLLTFDRDTGSRVSWQYMLFFKRMGLNVKYLPDNKATKGNYLTTMRQHGFEVLSSEYFDKHIEQWLKDNGRYIDYVYLNRPNVACKYIDLLRQYTKAQIIYQGYDLHFLREMRRYEASEDKAALQSSEKYKVIEMDVMQKSDVVCMFSDTEIAKIREILPNIKGYVVPLFIFDTELKKNIVYEGKARKDIMFVGGFNHNPNADGIKWFLRDIFPKIKKAVPDIKFYLVGSNPPPDIKALESEDVIVTGYVTDEELDNIYRNIKLSVVPLRFGAGVKGKVIEAIYNKVPVVTTSIGVEGIDNSDGLISVYDDANIFADELVKLYKNNQYLEEIAGKSHDFINKYYSEDAVKKVFRKMLRFGDVSSFIEDINNIKDRFCNI